MVIGIELKGLTPAISGLKQLQANIAALQASVKGAKAGGVYIQSATIAAINVQNATINQGTGRGGSGGGSGSGGKGSGVPKVPPLPSWAIPLTQGQKAAQKMQAATAAGNTAAADYWKSKIPVPPDFGTRLRTMLLSSRFGANGLMPLVSKTVDLLGVEAVIAAAGVKLLWGAATSAAESLTKFKDAMVVSGGSAQEVGQLKSFGDVAGVSDMAAAARQLSEKISSGGPAMGIAANKGIFDIGGAAFGKLDQARQLQKAIAVILDPKVSNEEAMRFARVLGLEPFVKMRDLSEQTKENLAEAGRASAMAHSTSATKNALEFDAAMSILGTNFDSMKTLVGDSVLPIFTAAIRVIGGLASGVNTLYSAVKPLVDQILSLGHRDASPNNFAKKLLPGMFGDADKDKTDEVTKDHTDAMKDHTSAMRGLFGGGENARRALPGAYQQNGGQADNWLGNAAGLGSMGV
jgi:hypothetical protein